MVKQVEPAVSGCAHAVTAASDFHPGAADRAADLHDGDLGERWAFSAAAGFGIFRLKKRCLQVLFWGWQGCPQHPLNPIAKAHLEDLGWPKKLTQSIPIP